MPFGSTCIAPKDLLNHLTFQSSGFESIPKTYLLWLTTHFFQLRTSSPVSKYGETCLNRTPRKPKTCLNRTPSKPKTCLNRTPIKPKTFLNRIPSKPKTCLNRSPSKPKTCLNRTPSKLKTCLNQTDFTVPSTNWLCN